MTTETMAGGRAPEDAHKTIAGVDFDPTKPLLQVNDLRVEFHTREGVAKAVNGLDFELLAGQTLGILGESGCGKSVTAQAIMGILDTPPARITGGEVLLQGVDVLRLSDEKRRKVRGNRIAMVFQDALSSLNPVFTVGWQLGELFREHRGMSRGDSKKEAARLLDMVGIPDARNRVDDYPHQFSGGMRQRVMIAMALALDPDVLIADEPTTALDVTVQAQVMRLLKDMQVERDMGLILITHDMGVVADVADKICVMYAGRVVERADVMSIYAAPAHPYTKALLESIPRVDMKGDQLASITGLPPNLTALPKGCNFHPRCRYKKAKCEQEVPPLFDVAEPVKSGPGAGSPRQSACHFYEEVLADDKA